MDKQVVIEATRRWISSMVIGLNLCPFARRVFQTEKIRYVVSDAQDETALREDLASELKVLASSAVSVFETTLLIHPCALIKFLDYNDFLGEGDRCIRALGLQGTIQIASFHPEYQFAGTDPGAPENYTNRSPYPMLHLLREASAAQESNGGGAGVRAQQLGGARALYRRGLPGHRQQRGRARDEADRYRT